MKNKVPFFVGFLVTAMAIDISAADPDKPDIGVSRVDDGRFIYLGFSNPLKGSPEQQAQSAAFRLLALQMGKEKFAKHQLPKDPVHEQLVQQNRQVLARAQKNRDQAAAANKAEHTPKN